MNFLAHAFLSGNNDEILLGNFIADSIKGSRFNQFEGDVRKGILLHRLIDSFMDEHEVVKESKARLRKVFGKFAPVVADVFYDHFLASQWQLFHTSSLKDFCMHTYSVLESHSAEMPEESRDMLPYMIRYNWLEGYAHVAGIGRALSGLARRTIPGSGMEKGAQELINNYEHYRTEFNLFFPDMITEAKRFIGS